MCAFAACGVVLPATTTASAIQGASRGNDQRKQKVELDLKKTHGGSTTQGSLLSWLAKFPLDNQVKTNYMGTCGTTNDAVVGVNAGQSFVSIAHKPLVMTTTLCRAMRPPFVRPVVGCWAMDFPSRHASTVSTLTTMATFF